MKPRSEQIQDTLAAEYALGTLQGRARQRFERWLASDVRLRRRVQAWQARLAPLDQALAPIQPSPRVWTNIERRLDGSSPTSAGLWRNLGFWRGATFASTAAALGLIALLAMTRGDLRTDTMVVVLQDQNNRPHITVSWAMDDKGYKELRVRVIGHEQMDPDTAWELWILPEENARPVSLGLITTHQTQRLVLPPELSAVVNDARGLAMSVEPAGGSPTGAPTGPVLYQGLSTRL